MLKWVSALAVLGLGACAAPEIVEDPIQSVDQAEAWSFSSSAAGLRDVSCPEGLKYARAQSIEITASEIERGPAEAQEKLPNRLAFAGAWHLTSDEPNFGGLSGLDTLRSGSLLAVSDAGAFIWIGIDPETAAPDGLGSIAYMRGQNDNYLRGKREGDSEGLAFRDGLALVSFERNHRIEAFDLEGCGSAARAASVVALPDEIEGEEVSSNNGPEALRLTGDGMVVGYEERIGGDAVLGSVDMAGHFSVTERRLSDHDNALTGTDYDEELDLTVNLYRWYRPVLGNRIKLEVLDADGAIVASLAPPLPVDNFEGVAIGRNLEGQPRIWIVSDDNFKPGRQRTLLFAFDLT